MSFLPRTLNRSKFSAKHPGAVFASGVLFLAVFLSGCDQQTTNSTPVKTTEEPAQVTEAASADQISQAETTALAFNGWLKNSFEETASQIDQLTNACDVFYQTPNNETLIQVKQSWQKAHAAFSQTALLFSLSKASPDLFYTLESWQNLLDAYTVEPGYLDSFDIYVHSGIVNDTLLTINAETIRQQHQLTHSDEIALGFHALEFLIWGENNNRPLSMFIADKESDSPAKQPQNRRRDFIRLLARLLVDDYNNLRTHWQNSIEVQLTRLSPLSQAQLWKQALAEYWREHAIEVLRADPSSEELVAHTRFAGETASEHVLSSVSVLANLIEQAKTTSNSGLYPPATQSEIVSILSEMQVILSENSEAETTDNPSENTDTTTQTSEITETVSIQVRKKSQALALSEKIGLLLGY